ncbi:diguanylate cyclase [Gemmobacter tilapiae]|uniref:Diguanylate cyclase n=2 Tax=Neogemmobacter tilapiae TaxID=875041 RepID=A0A918TKD8_9RHOB|nr:diguanylate cyclase [Gemmobacter tilapiae]
MAFDWLLVLGLALSAVFAAGGGILILAALQVGQRRVPHGLFSGQADEVAFLFDGETLLDATPSGRSMLRLGPPIDNARARLVANLSTRFPKFPELLEGLPRDGSFVLTSGDGSGRHSFLQAELRGGLTRIALVSDDHATGVGTDAQTLVTMEAEIAALRAAVSRAPYLIWRQDQKGQVVWANGAYLVEAVERLDAGQDLRWPLPHVFDQAVSVEGAAVRRLFVEKANAGKQWFEVQSVEDGESTLFFALPADAAVAAEAALRDFMQTLTKTFAELPTGLAIFDRRRQLQLFNPALVDLTGLPPDLLSVRPTLFAFLDALRDRHMIPEPRDYRHWRNQMTELEEAAANGQYQETWNLPSGQTFRVIGRPHPNGALALMFEDITPEMARTRRYRADLELGQSVIDAMEDAVAVFAGNGQLVMTNAAYGALWGHDPTTQLIEAGIEGVASWWRDHSAPSNLWAEAERFVARMGSSGECRGEVRLFDGRLVACRFRPLHGGATLAAFRVLSPDSSRSGQRSLRMA